MEWRYKRYVSDDNVPVPRTTAWRWKRRRLKYQSDTTDSIMNVPTSDVEQLDHYQDADKHVPHDSEPLDMQSDTERSDHELDYGGLDESNSQTLTITDSNTLADAEQFDHGHDVVGCSENEASSSACPAVTPGNLSLDGHDTHDSEPPDMQSDTEQQSDSDLYFGGPGESNSQTLSSDSEAPNTQSDSESSDIGLDCDEQNESNSQTLSIPVSAAQSDAEQFDHGLDVDGCVSHSQIDACSSTGPAMTPGNLSLLLLKLKHGLTKEAIKDIAKLINIGLNKTETVATSIHQLEKHFATGQSFVEVHHVCSQCLSYIGVVSGDLLQCPFDDCGLDKTVKENVNDGNFFLYLPLRHQLVDLLQNHNIFHLLHDSCSISNDSYSDIFDGLLYKDLLGNQPDHCRILSLTFNCDGVPVFKSSLFSIWPILCVVNELPPKLRHEHVLMAALWFGCGKPDMNVFFKPFVKECISLHHDGFTCRPPSFDHELFVRVYVLVGVCDAVARPLVQNFKQFNGLHGCGFCMDEGEIVDKGCGTVRVYQYNPQMLLRNPQNTKCQVREVAETGRPSKGVKGPSVLSMLPHFNIIDGMVPDYMHCICLGVVRQMATLWFDAKNHDALFYIGTLTSSVDACLLCIQPPCTISRTPRSISVMRFWKAHEWLAWLLYYSLPVLKGILPIKYLAHWAILVDCISIMLGTNITNDQLQNCETAISRFVQLFPVLYGKQNLSFNVHQTLHLVNSVKNWGPLWSHSAFLYESFNAVLLRMIRGTQGVPIQILHVFSLTRAVPSNVSNTLPQCTDEQKSFIRYLISKKKHLEHVKHINDNVIVLGRPRIKLLQRTHFVALCNVCPGCSDGSVVEYYDKIIVDGEVVHSQLYSKTVKRNSYTVLLTNGCHYSILTFIVLGSECYAVGHYLEQQPFRLCADRTLVLSHIIPVSRSIGVLSAISARDIKQKCVFMSIAKHQVDFICYHVSTFESCT